MFILFLTLAVACVLVALVLPRTLWGSRGGLSLAGIAFFGALAALCAGCASTTITEYDDQGNVVKVTESDESAFAIAAQSIQTKDNMLHASGWAVGVQPSAGIYGVGAFDVLAGSINAETGAANAASYAAMINASKVSLDVTANAEGITAKAQSNEDAAATPNSNAGAERMEDK
ncbi:MAG: hypothetical protein J6J65_00440 [Opitutales bacterium]|nr:hypothetical protein [Opitutales bacterium]